jgi:hypothetical protein
MKREKKQNQKNKNRAIDEGVPRCTSDSSSELATAIQRATEV